MSFAFTNKRIDIWVKLKWIIKDDNSLYSFKASNKNLKELNELRIKNVNLISEMACKLFNAAKIYKD